MKVSTTTFEVSVDGSEPTSLASFYEINDCLDSDDISDIECLAIGDSVYIGFSEVERTA